MAKKQTETTEKPVETKREEPVEAKQEKPERSNASGFYIYLGPNIKKHIQTGTVYRGTRAHALKQAAAAIEAYPLVKTLIVSGDALPEARIKVKTPGNVLYANYQQIVRMAASSGHARFNTARPLDGAAAVSQLAGKEGK